jgi:hypothetical protein
VRLRLGSVTRCGEAVTVAQRVDPRRLVAAVAAEDTVDGEVPVRVDCPAPGPLHEHVGRIRAGMGLRPKPALAAAARSRGMGTPHDEALAEARERLARFSVETVASEAERRAVAEVQRETERLRERVAAARGRLLAAREADGDEAAAGERLQAAIRELSEVETRAEAARERLGTVRERRRAVRDRLDRRLRLEDRVANLERDARAHLVDRLRDPYREALAALPGAPADPAEASASAAALAVARVGEPSAPIVLEDHRFGDAVAAREWLGAPVIYIR